MIVRNLQSSERSYIPEVAGDSRGTDLKIRFCIRRGEMPGLLQFCCIGNDILIVKT